MEHEPNRPILPESYSFCGFKSTEQWISQQRHVLSNCDLYSAVPELIIHVKGEKKFTKVVSQEAALVSVEAIIGCVAP